MNTFSSAIVQLSLEDCRETADQSIQRSYENANEQWKTEALRIVRDLCKNRQSFDLDDVAASANDIEPQTHDNRATGGIMKHAMASGWCRQSGIGRSKRPSRHGGYIAVYESLIFSPAV